MWGGGRLSCPSGVQSPAKLYFGLCTPDGDSDSAKLYFGHISLSFLRRHVSGRRNSLSFQDTFPQRHCFWSVEFLVVQKTESFVTSLEVTPKPPSTETLFIMYNESRKANLKKRRKNEYRCDERLKTKVEERTCLGYTGLDEELEHLKIKTRLTSTKPVNVMSEYPIDNCCLLWINKARAI